MAEQGVVSEMSNLNNPQHSFIDWQEVCRMMLEKSLPLDSVNTQPDGIIQTSQNVPPFLKIFSNQQPSFRITQPHSQFRSSQTEESQGYSPEKLLHKLLELDLPSPQGKRLAIIGEGGRGKTLFLREIAHLFLEGNFVNDPLTELNEKTEDLEIDESSPLDLLDFLARNNEAEYFPIWISPSQLKTLSLKDYLWGPWLQQAAKGQDFEIWQESFLQLLNGGKVWILADGIDYFELDPENAVKTGPLSWFGRSLKDFAEPINLILTCRTETWKLDPKGVSEFDRYQTRKLDYPIAVEATIKHWFGANQINIGQNLSLDDPSEDLGQQLCETLAQPEQESIRQWLTNPLCLVLCCRFWQRRPDVFPKNSAELYEQLIAEFYQWKAEQLSTSLQQQRSLSQELGKLAKQILLNQTGYTQAIAQAEIEACWGQESPYLRLALQLGWLIKRGGVESPSSSESAPQSTINDHYGFCDRIFRDYFASLAIGDWHFFLDIAERNYRLFEPQWQNVIYFWVGRSDIHSSQKDEFVKALITFEDRFSEYNFYGKRAYFLAVKILNSFQECIYRETLLTQLKKWSEGKSEGKIVKSSSFRNSARTLLTQTYCPFVIELYLNALKEAKMPLEYQSIGNVLVQFGKGSLTAIKRLEDYLATLTDSFFCYSLAETLGLIDPGNKSAIATFIPALDEPKKTEACQIALTGLSKIGVGNVEAIAAVVEFLASDLTPHQQRQALTCLEIIGKGDSLAIACLLQRFRVYREGSPRCQTAESLEKIDPGNPTAISVLLHLLQPNQTTEVRKQAIYSLGETSASYPQAVTALIHLLQTDEDIFIRWLTVSSLSKIGQENEAVIKAFEDLIEEFQDNLQLKETGWLITEVMEALGKIDPKNPILLKTLVQLIQSDVRDGHQEVAERLGKLDPGNPTAIAVLGELLKNQEDEFTQRQAAESLGKIDSGNLEALTVLIHLLQQGQTADVRRLSAKSLGEINSHNAAAIAALIRTALITPDKETRRATVQSLGKIAVGNREACQTFIDLLRVQSDQSLHLEIAENLIKILSQSLMPFVIHPLKASLLNSVHQADTALYEIFWHCAQSLTYETFYQAWYQLPLDAAPATSQDSLSAIALPGSPQPLEKTKLDLQKDLMREIQNNSPLDDLIQLIWIDCSQFLVPDEPMIDIYDQMLTQNCPEFDNGIPDNLAKLRLYWRLLQKHQPEKTYIWLFDHSAKACSPFSAVFLEKLNTFKGNIAIISDKENNPIPHFSPHSSQLISSIIDWIKAQINKF